MGWAYHAGMSVSDRPDLTVLSLLAGVADHGSLGAAARSVGMAQPNASRAVRAYERRLGFPLLDRSPNGSRLTAEGTVVAQLARRVIQAADDLAEGAAALRAEHRSILTVGASMTVAEYLVPAWLGEFRRGHPDTAVQLEVHNSTEIFELVGAGRCELGMVESPGVPNTLRSTVIARDELVLVVPAGHPWTRRRRPIQKAELAATPLVIRESGSGTRTTLDQALAGYRCAEPAAELGSGAAVRTGVLAGLGPSVVSSLGLPAAGLVVVEVAGLDLTRRLRAVWRPDRKPHGPTAELIAIARRSQPARA